MGCLCFVFFVAVQYYPMGKGGDSCSFLHHLPGELCVGNESCYYSYYSDIIVSEHLLFPPLAFQS